VIPAQDVALEVEGLRVGYGQTQVLHIDHLTVRRNVITALVGPVAAGKSTFVRHLVGLDELIPSSWSEGSVRLIPSPRTSARRRAGSERIQLIPQKARLYLRTLRDNILANESDITVGNARLDALLAQLPASRHFSRFLDLDVGECSLAVHRAGLLLRTLLDEPEILLLDEPLSDVAMADEEWLLELLQELKGRLTVIMVSHNKNQVRQVADWVVFITGGALVEVAPADRFFNQPASDLAREFLLSGSAWPSPRLYQEEEEVVEEVPAPHPQPATDREMGLRWVIPGSLGGMHQPGLLGDMDGDFAALNALGVDTLVTLTEAPLDTSAADPGRLRVLWLPIDDMQAPELDACRQLLSELNVEMEQGRHVVFHCRGGLGRTGLMLACFLIAHRGMSPEQAIEHVRKVNPNYIQSQVQVDFVKAFAGADT
jgi:atypical dual specificity phosphatase